MPRILNLQQSNKTEIQKNENPNIQKSAAPDGFSWTSSEFDYNPKSAKWHIISAAAALALIIWSVFFNKNLFFIIFVILSYITFVLMARKKPKIIKIEIINRGIAVGKTLYLFESLKSFWIFYDPPRIKELSLRSKKLIMPYVKIPLGDENPVDIREVLLQYLPEKKHKESIIDNWMKFIGY